MKSGRARLIAALLLASPVLPTLTALTALRSVAWADDAPLTDADFKRVEEMVKRRAEEAKKKAAAEAAARANPAAKPATPAPSPTPSAPATPAPTAPAAAPPKTPDAAAQQNPAATQKSPAAPQQAPDAKAKPAAASPAAAPAEEVDDSPVAVEQRLDAALEHYYAKRYPQAAAALLATYRTLPETDLKRDTVAFFLAESLESLGFAEGAVEHHVDIVLGRRTPDLVMRSLASLDRLVRARRYDESRLIDEVLFGNQFGDLPPDVHEFVEYYQGLGELRRGFGALGEKRLELLAADPVGKPGANASSGYYRYKARYALAVDDLSRRSDEAAEKQLRAMVDDEAAPGPVRNEARTALARQLYEQKRYAEAFELYAKNDAPIETQDVILIEKAWAKVGARDEQRALGMVVGLGAPVYKLGFSPERWLIRASSLDRLCQFRDAHVAVRSFRSTFAESLRRIRERASLEGDPVIRTAALGRVDLVPAAAWQARIQRERGRLGTVADEKLRAHLTLIYDTRGAQAEAAVARTLERALDVVADDLLVVDEQMTILDYEIGVGLFKGVTGEHRDRAAASLEPIPYGSNRVYHRFDGEYWSDEIQDFQVRVEDRCLR